MRLSLILIAATGVACASSAQAANVTLNANLTSSCTLTLSSSGAMTVSPTGTILGSEQSGGSSASMTLIAVGILPTVSFAAPSLVNPAGWSASHTNEIRYTSTRGASQAYTGSASSFVETGLTDTFTVHGRVTSAEGFAAGNYTLTSVVTCS